MEYHTTRPREAVAQRVRLPVAYLGVLGEDPLAYASAEFGREILDELEAALREQIKDLT